ncbi:MAG: amidohydrolase family protein, partial [Desulfovibrionaceae bacterium]|nr:amidohydrolase family protein [Desulfovibrionaceae bacterium]
MATILIRNASLFSPDPLGTNDILIINDRIAAIAQNVSVPEWLGPVQEMDGKGLFAVPGFIDAHVHITGGGGEAGFSSQVPPLPLSKLIRSGVTTVGGLLGTDGVTRHVDAVLAKANSLEEEGVSSFIMSGGYPVPSPTLTGSIRSDIAF